MVQSFYTAANGLTSQQFNIDVIAANMANVNTNGYKAGRADFKEALYTRMRNPVDIGEHLNLQLGTGALPLQNNRILEQGAALTTNRTLDFMIQGSGYFTVQGFDAEGEEMSLYTRNGSFYLTPDNELVDAAGRYVLSNEGDTIVVEGAPSKMSVAPDGMLMFADEEGNQYESDIRLGIADFINPNGLVAAGDNLYMETENSGEAEFLEEPNVVSGTLEASNVSIAQEMTRLVRAQRAYQFASRAISVADQMAGLANTIRQ